MSFPPVPLRPVVVAFLLGTLVHSSIMGADTYAVLLAALLLVEGWSAVVLGPVYGIMTLLVGVLALVLASVEHRASPRLWFVSAVAAAGATYVAAAFAPGPLWFGLLYVLGFGYAYAAAGSSMFAGWLARLGSRRLEFRMSLYFAAGLLTTSTVGSLLNALIGAQGWRLAIGVIGGGCLALAAALACCRWPDVPRGAAAVPRLGWRAGCRLVISDPAVWRINLFNLFGGFGTYALFLLPVVGLVAGGWDREPAGYAYAWMVGVTPIGTCVVGRALGTRWRVPVLVASRVVAASALALVAAMPWVAPGALWPALALGVGLAVSFSSYLAVGTAAMVSYTVGRSSPSFAAAVVLAFGCVSWAVAAVVSGLFIQYVGVWAALALAAVGILASLVCFLAEPALRRRP